MMKRIISIFLSLIPIVLFAQSIERQVIGSTGGFIAESTVQVSSTVGEAVIATDSGASIILTLNLISHSLSLARDVRKNQRERNVGLCESLEFE